MSLSTSGLLCIGLLTSPLIRGGFSALAGVLAGAAWGVRALPSFESTLRMATVLTASLLLGVARRFLSLGALGAGDLKAGLSWVLLGFGVSVSLRFGGGSGGCGSTDSTGRFRAGGGGF